MGTTNARGDSYTLKETGTSTNNISFKTFSTTAAALFFINGIAVLSEDRFLARIGWSANTSSNANSGSMNFGGNSQYGYGDFNGSIGSMTSGSDGIKSRVINLISATRTLLRIPLIIVNIVVIIYELILG